MLLHICWYDFQHVYFHSEFHHELDKKNSRTTMKKTHISSKPETYQKNKSYLILFVCLFLHYLNVRYLSYLSLVIANPPNTSWGSVFETSGDVRGFKHRSSPGVWMSRVSSICIYLRNFAQLLHQSIVSWTGLPLIAPKHFLHQADIVKPTFWSFRWR